MFKYINKKDFTLVEAPVRFDLRLREYNHLRLHIEIGPQQPPQLKKIGYSMYDIAKEWGCTYHTVLQYRAKKLLPPPDGKFGTNLIWNKMPKSPWSQKTEGFTLREVADFNHVSSLQVKLMIKLGEVKDADLVLRRFKCRPVKMWSEMPVILKKTKLEIIDLELK